MFGVKNLRFQIEDFRLRGNVGNFAMTRNQGKSKIYNLKLLISAKFVPQIPLPRSASE
jgi:hypothetical protein